MTSEARTGHGDRERAQRARLIAHLRARRSQIEREIYARVSDRRFDQRGSDDPEYVAGLLAASTAALDYVFAGVEHWGELLAPVPLEALAQARRAARVGVGLDTVLRRYIAGHAVLEDFVMQETERGVLLAHGPVLREVLAILYVLVDRLSVAASDAYAKECRRGGDLAVDDAHPQDEGSDPGRAIPDGGVGKSAAAGVARERVLRAFVEVAAQRGWADTSVGLVLARARMSRRTLYELFPGGLQDCLLAVLDETGRRVFTLAAQRLQAAGCWQEGVREALAALLVFFDSEPGLARVCHVEALAGGQMVVERREAAVTAVRELIVAYVNREAGTEIDQLAAESGIASVMGIIYKRFLAREQRPLIEMLGPLMGLIAAPYLDPASVQEEVLQAERLARAIQAGAPGWEIEPAGSPSDAQAQAPLPALLANPKARRARQCLLHIADRAQCGCHPSNAEVASAIGVKNKGQISRLLSQLQREGLLVKHKAGVAEPNAWSLTQRGKSAAQALADSERLTI